VRTAEGDVSIELAGPERLDELRPLWESLSDHHVEVAPRLRGLGPVRTSAESWDVRRAHYVSLFEDNPSAFALIASAARSPVGYALVQIRGPEESWDTGPVAVLETLAVLPAHRRRGIGAALVEATMAQLRSLGIGHWEVATIATNEEALRFYERLNLLPFTVNFIGLVPADEDGTG
jgi:ribosomal protein S18 acetylase RimI-like enzyme